LTALPTRLIALLESDILQTLPLYVLLGTLLDRLGLADALFATLQRLVRRSAAAPLLAGMGVGALLGPVNGSVGASVLALSRVLPARLTAQGVAPAQQHAAVAVASTFGVVIPPSLVLILLGDALLDAHTIAVNATGRSDTIINSDALFRAALLPALVLVLLSAAAALWSMRKRARVTAPPLARATALLALTAGTVLALLLGAVTLGVFKAVDAAAVATALALAGGLASGRLRGPVLRGALQDALSSTGALFALLLAATTLTLVLRVLGTPALVATWIAALPGNDVAVVACVIVAVVLTAFVLDAYEAIFVVVPIVIPPLLIRVADVQWVAVLTLLALQLSFLLPPLGYAVLMTASWMPPPHPAPRAAWHALRPFVAVQCLVLALVLAFPALSHPFGALADRPAAPTGAGQLEDVVPPPPPDLPPELLPQDAQRPAAPGR
jgi:tripartite ATP-independent transporter DctM subunit